MGRQGGGFNRHIFRNFFRDVSRVILICSSRTLIMRESRNNRVRQKSGERKEAGESRPLLGGDFVLAPINIKTYVPARADQI
jgi:hypothetical protein